MVLFTSCKFNSADPNDNVANTFTVNGMGYTDAVFTLYEADSGGVAYASDTVPGIFHMKGLTNKNGERYVLGFYTKYGAVGTYQINTPEGGTAMTLVVFAGGTQYDYFATIGYIAIDECQAKGGFVKGRFEASFTIGTDVVVNALQVTSGSFELRRVY